MARTNTLPTLTYLEPVQPECALQPAGAVLRTKGPGWIRKAACPKGEEVGGPTAPNQKSWGVR